MLMLGQNVNARLKKALDFTEELSSWGDCQSKPFRLLIAENKVFGYFTEFKEIISSIWGGGEGRKDGGEKEKMRREEEADLFWEAKYHRS